MLMTEKLMDVRELHSIKDYDPFLYSPGYSDESTYMNPHEKLLESWAQTN